MEKNNIKKEAVSLLLDKGILVSPDILEEMDSVNDMQNLYNFLKNKISNEDFFIISDDIKKLQEKKNIEDINWKEFDKSRAYYEKNKGKKTYDGFIDYINEKDPKGPTPQMDKKGTWDQEGKEPVYDTLESKKEITDYNVNVIFDYKDKEKKREIQDFVKYFNVRYASIESMLRDRSELKNLMSIRRGIEKKDRSEMSIIGMVYEKTLTKNGNIMITLEDPGGKINVLVNKNKPDLFEKAEDIVHDEVIGVCGVNGQNIIFANNVVFPDVPITKELKKSSDEVHALFLSDLHVGSDTFLPEAFNKLMKWLNGEIGNDVQKKMASKVKYIFITGDLVDGVGIYPGQENDLKIKNIQDQYKFCYEFLEKIPRDKNIIICPGNHDAIRLNEPQPRIYRDFLGSIMEMENLTMVSNPGIVNIHSSKDFKGFDVLLYHGTSYDYYMQNVSSIRTNGGYDRADLLMKFLLKKRHLAPTHSSTSYIPDVENDSLVIDKIPDFFLSGHIHKTSIARYRNVDMICSSCWQSQTDFQIKVGLHPEPCRVPVANLKTREIKILKFN